MCLQGGARARGGRGAGKGEGPLYLLLRVHRILLVARRPEEQEALPAQELRHGRLHAFRRAGKEAAASQCDFRISRVAPFTARSSALVRLRSHPLCSVAQNSREPSILFPPSRYSARARHLILRVVLAGRVQSIPRDQRHRVCTRRGTGVRVFPSPSLCINFTRVVAIMPFVWRGRTESPTTRAGPSLDVALRLE